MERVEASEVLKGREMEKMEWVRVDGRLVSSRGWVGPSHILCISDQCAAHRYLSREYRHLQGFSNV